MPDRDDGSVEPAAGHRRVRAWLLMTAAVAAVMAGVALPHGLLPAAGLIACACATHLFDTT
ncbi:hypothetical protein AB0D54_17220 [Streptomyces xanthophaeus]|uniref:hypothetical protein n=1 Tax=Streptomyces xanthophaeus TaxID=67385 RepID=UPI003444292B